MKKNDQSGRGQLAQSDVGGVRVLKSVRHVKNLHIFELKQKQQTTAPSSTSNLESKLYSVTINESPSDNSTTILISIRAMTKIIAVKFNSIIETQPILKQVECRNHLLFNELINKSSLLC